MRFPHSPQTGEVVVGVSESTRSDSTLYGPIASCRQELHAVTEERMRLQGELQSCSTVAQKRENAQYVLANRGPRNWLIRKKQMQEKQELLAGQLKTAENQQRSLKSKLRYLHGNLRKEEDKQFGPEHRTLRKTVDELRERIERLERDLRQLSAT